MWLSITRRWDAGVSVGLDDSAFGVEQPSVADGSLGRPFGFGRLVQIEDLSQRWIAAARCVSTGIHPAWWDLVRPLKSTASVYAVGIGYVRLDVALDPPESAVW